MIKTIKNPLKMSGLFVCYGNAGAMMETKGRNGTSHLMEHMVCKTTDHMRDRFLENAIQNNAFTADEYVVFFLAGLTSRMKPMAREYVQSIVGPVSGLNPRIESVTREQFDYEKLTVLQEYGLHFSNPMRGPVSNALRKWFGYIGAIGTREDVEKFTYSDFRDAYYETFNKPSMVLYVGPTDIKLPSVNCAAHNSFRQFPSYKKNWDIELEPLPDNGRSPIVVSSKRMCIMEDATALELVLNILSADLNAPLYQEIREKRGLSYYSHAYMKTLGDAAVPVFTADTDRKNIGKLKKVYNMVFSDLENYVTEERFRSCVSLAKAVQDTRKILRYEDCEDILRKHLDLIRTDVNIGSLTFGRVLEVAKKYLSPENILMYTP